MYHVNAMIMDLTSAYSFWSGYIQKSTVYGAALLCFVRVDIQKTNNALLQNVAGLIIIHLAFKYNKVILIS